MAGKRLMIYSLFLFVLPILVAWFGFSVTGVIAVLVVALIWRWAISLSILIAPANTPELELESISASHFVEKVRWCLDRLGVEYSEKPVGGTLGAFFLGRTVPVLKFKAGAVRSSIGNSPEILRYLWGRYAVEMEEQAQFLEPTKERLEFEKQVDRCGVDLQVWVYYHILDEKKLTLHAWGSNSPAIPAWQRLVLRLLFPLLRSLIRKSFRITQGRFEKSVEHIETMLATVESRLSDGRKSILGGKTLNFTDLGFAAIMGLWLQPPGYGGGKMDAVQIERERCPTRMRKEIETWSVSYPQTTGFIRQLYENERL